MDSLTYSMNASSILEFAVYHLGKLPARLKVAPSPVEVEKLLDIAMRIVNETLVASDLANNISNDQLHKCIDNLINIITASGLQHLFSQIDITRQLYAYLSSTKYAAIKSNGYNDVVVSGLKSEATLLWGESLYLFAEHYLVGWKQEYATTLRLAEKVIKSYLQVQPRSGIAHYSLGKVYLSLANTFGSKSDASYRTHIQNAFHHLSSAVNITTTQEYLLGLSLVLAVLGQEVECKDTLSEARTKSPLDADFLNKKEFDPFRQRSWFKDLSENGAAPSASSYVPPSVGPPSTLFSPSIRQTPSYTSHQPSPPLTHSEALFANILEEQQFNLLQSSMVADGSFGIRKLLDFFGVHKPSSGKTQQQPPEEESEHVKIQKARLQRRLDMYQLKPKREIPGDGNCQMHAISDQIYNDIEHSTEIRRIVVNWLRENKNWKLPNECVLHEFVHDKTWEEYCDLMAKNGCWGDHLTLLALSEIFGVVIAIISSVEGDNFITEVQPTVKKMNKVLLLSHFAEFHYGSLTHISEPVTPGGP